MRTRKKTDAAVVAVAVSGAGAGVVGGMWGCGDDRSIAFASCFSVFLIHIFNSYLLPMVYYF